MELNTASRKAAWFMNPWRRAKAFSFRVPRLPLRLPPTLAVLLGNQSSVSLPAG
ncbi:hypothetical protein ACS15_1462 [Ralstonia insidiosa]|uniref:Uncharacterized protein n=1 Tax=Ralstonia insidiosa TaxID=190721 RepID=A0AAC9BJT4_9RALS|nr:hypothetical protein ACS15_1462 [Ralstonia insidiosa]